MLQLGGQPSTVFRFVNASKHVGLKVVRAVVADDLVRRMSGLDIEAVTNAGTRLTTAERCLRHSAGAPRMSLTSILETI